MVLPGEPRRHRSVCRGAGPPPPRRRTRSAGGRARSRARGGTDVRARGCLRVSLPDSIRTDPRRSPGHRARARCGALPPMARRAASRRRSRAHVRDGPRARRAHGRQVGGSPRGRDHSLGQPRLDLPTGHHDAMGETSVRWPLPARQVRRLRAPGRRPRAAPGRHPGRHTARCFARRAAAAGPPGDRSVHERSHRTQPGHAARDAGHRRSLRAAHRMGARGRDGQRRSSRKAHAQPARLQSG